MSLKRQLSLAAGEIDPLYYGRTDQVRNASGCKTARNFQGIKSGGLQNRSGTQYKGPILQPTLAARTRVWRFSDAQTYQLEWSNLKLAFWKDGAYVTEANLTITGATKANPCVLTITSHGLSTGDTVYVQNVAGMVEINNNYWRVTSTGANTVSLQWAGQGTASGTNLNSTSFATYTSGGTAARVYTVTTTYATADLPNMQFAQSASTMVITCSGHPLRSLTRASDTSWTLTTPTYGPATAFPTSGAATAGAVSTSTFNYMVTSENETTGIESLSGSAHTRTVSGITKANPGVVTVSSTVDTIYQTGDEIIFTTVSGMTELSNRRFKIARLSTTTFQLVGEDTTSYGTFTSGSVFLAHINLQSADDPTAAAPNVITTNAAATAGVRYNVYKEVAGIYGFIGSTYGLTFNDTGLVPDTLASVPIYREPFQGSNNYPTACVFYQGRLIAGGSTNLPNGADGSVQNDPFNFTIHVPPEDTDAVRFKTEGYVDQLRHMAPLDRLVAFTSGAEFVVAGGGEGGALTPQETNVRPRTYNGSGSLFPLPIDSNILYRPGSGTAVLDFHYSIETGEAGGYLAADRMLFSGHLLKGHTIVDWAYQRAPDSTVWMVREDGTVLSMTYVPGQQLFCPTRHDLYGGVAENVVVVREGSDEDAEDVVYFVVKRTLGDGTSTRYMERLASRQYTDIKDAIFLDSALSYDGTGTGTVTLSGSGWTNATSLTATFSTAQTNATVGNEIQLTNPDSTATLEQLRCRITEVTSTTIVTVIPHTTVPTNMRAVAISAWLMGVDSFTRLYHLEGETVSVIGDGMVIASALNTTAYETSYTVSSGTITLEGDQRPGRAHVGIPITADIVTLDPDPPEDGRWMSSMKNVKAVGVRIAESRSFYIGTELPTGSDPVSKLYEPKIRNDESYDDPLALTTGVVKIRTRSGFNRNGSVVIRVMEPAPVTVLAIQALGSVYGD